RDPARGDMPIAMSRFTRSFACSGRLRQQGAHADQVVRRGGEDEVPVDPPTAAMAQLPEQADRFHPTKALLDEFALALTDRVAGMARGPGIDRTPAAHRLGKLGDMRG